ncbi:MAG: aminopeptidase P family protein [Bacteroidetes bacterium]|nr:aminopeptidase P family protein [Bacteroidota bacterium]MBS1980561.1 aminopeptidase P family protein [Bacteroidota bacterium]
MKPLITPLLVLVSILCWAQESDLPNDFLSKTFYRERREKLREKLPAHSVAVFFANPVRNRSNDVDFVYHQDPDFYYLTGYKEPDALLLVFKDQQISANGTTYNEVIFVQPRNELREMWTGRRLGEKGVKENLGFSQAFNNSVFKKYNIDFSKFASILFFDFKNDVRDNPRDSSDLFNLIAQFKTKVNYPDAGHPTLTVEPKKNNLDISGLEPIMDNLRGIKTNEEIELVRKAVRISCAGQVEVMKAIKPGMSEREIQGIHEFVFKKYQAEDVGYPSIVGAGHNGCILHYEENYKPSISNKELILMDLGAEYRGYTADITRTIPVNGKFSPEQKQIYELVLKAQEEAMKICKPGTSFQEVYLATRTVINKGLKELGILQNETDRHMYYPHGCTHHIGLDVHDRGPYEKLQEGMMITIEPGIYIPENSPCDKKWWGIAVRIEDDYLITQDGYEHLSAAAPRTVKDVEAMMKQPSALDDFVLPELDKKN